MNPAPQYVSPRTASVHHQSTLSLRQGPPDVTPPRSLLNWIDYDHYTSTVLRISPGTTEDEIDKSLRKMAETLGLNTLKVITNIESITSFKSATTLASDPTIQSSIMSQSTAPTSCSSSEVRPLKSSMHKSEYIPDNQSEYAPSPTLLDMEKKRRNTGFKNGFRRMTNFSKKLKSVKSPISPTLTSISSYSDIDASVNGDGHSMISDVKSPSIKSKESSGLWSHRLSTTNKSSYEHEISLIDHDALRRSMECQEMISLRARQLEERQRFLDYQSELVSKIRGQRDIVKGQKSEVHDLAVDEQKGKNDKATEDLETRHLEEESKMRKEHDVEKRTVMVRLRHMEAYCQTPSPPPTPSDIMFMSRFPSPSSPISARDSVDSMNATFPTIVVPERKVTDKDYHSLAAQYRERDAMDNLHASKINVLRGRQQRALENFMLRRERDVEKLEVEHQKELDNVDFEFGRQEADCRSEFDVLRRRLEGRWRLQAKIERRKREDSTGLKFESLPDVPCVDSCSVELMLRPTTIPVREPRELPNQIMVAAR